MRSVHHSDMLSASTPDHSRPIRRATLARLEPVCSAARLANIAGRRPPATPLTGAGFGGTPGARRGVLIAVAALSLGAGCGSGGAAASTGRVTIGDPEGVVTSDARGRQIRVDAGGPVADTLPASADSVFRAVVRAYGELGIQTPLLETWARRVGDPRMTVTRTFRNMALSRLLSCGDGLTGPRANTDRIMLSIVSQVQPNPGGGSRLETRVSAVAMDTGGRGGQAQCTSTGELEELLHRVARAALTS